MPTFSFTSPDGKTYDVEGPEGSTKEQAFQILQQRMEGSPTDSVKESPSTSGVAVNAWNKGMAAALDALPNAPQNIINLGKMGFGAAATAIGKPDWAPEITPPPNYVRRGFEKVGSIRPDLEPATGFQRGVDTLMQGAAGGAMAPAASIGRMGMNMLYGDIGAVSAETAKNATGSEAWGALAGFAGPAGVANIGRAPGAAYVRDKVLSVTSPDMRAGRMISDTLTDKGRSTLRLDDPNIVPGSEQTLAQKTRDPGAAGLELWARQQPQAKGLFSARDAEQAAAREAELRRIAPGDDGLNVVQGRVEQIMGRIEAAATGRVTAARATTARARADADAAQREINKWNQIATETTGPAMRSEAAGTVVRQAIEAEKAALEAARDAATRPLREQAYESGAKADTTPIGKQINDWLEVEQSPTQRAMLEQVRKMVAPGVKEVTEAAPAGAEWMPLKPKSKEVKTEKTLEQLDSARRAINELKTGAGGDSGERLADHYLKGIAGPGGLLDQQMKLASRPYEDYLAKYSEMSRPLDPYGHGTLTGKVLATDPYGKRYLTPDAEVMGRFFMAGNRGVAGAQEFLTAVKGNPEAMKAMRGYIAEQISTRDGAISSTQLANFTRQNSNALRTLGMEGEFKTMSKAGQYLVDLAEAKALDVKRAEVAAKGVESDAVDMVARANKTALGKFMKQDPDKALSSIMTSFDREQKLKSLVGMMRGDPAALDGLRQGLKDFVFDRRNAGRDYLENPRESLAKQMNAWQEYKPILERTGAFTPDHVTNMDKVFQDLDRSQYAATAGRTAGVSTTHQFKSMGEYMASRVIANAASIASGAVGGAGGYAYAGLPGVAAGAVVGGGVAWWSNALKNMTTDRIVAAALDPKFAKQLVQQYDARRATAMAPDMAKMSMSVANAVNAMAQQQEMPQQ